MNRCEFHYGSFRRIVPVAVGTKAEDVTATYTDGVLEVRVPKQAEEDPVSVRIPVQRSEQQED